MSGVASRVCFPVSPGGWFAPEMRLTVAYAQRLGATGLTFCDDEVTVFFSPHTGCESAISVVAVGNSAKQKA